MNQKDLQAITKRTERYWFEDGIWEICFGLVNMLLAGFYLLAGRLEAAGEWLVALQMLVIVGAFLGMGRLVKLLKERITYPRTGYVAYRKPAPSARVKRAVLTGLLALLMAGIVGAAATVRLMRNTTALVAAILLAGALVYLGYRFSLPRLYLTAGLTVGLGFVFALLALPDSAATAGFFGAFGLLVTLSGGAALAAYLARSRAGSGPAEEQEA
jgi:hypothetical protein